MNRREFLHHSLGGAGALATAQSMCGIAEAAQPRQRPNILLLMDDQHRGDCLGADGNRVIKTPHLDRLAREGVRFRHGYSCTPTCTPARTALLTGLSPWKNGMLGYGKVAEHYEVELPQAMRDAGYYTLGIGKMHWSPQRNLHGFHRTILDESGRVENPGFISDYRTWFKKVAPDKDPDATGIGWNEYQSAVYALPEELHPTRWTADTAVDFIENYRQSEPFFAKVSFARPHSPYDPPQRFMEAYREDDLPAPWIGEWAARHAKHYEKPNPNLWEGDLGVKQARRSRRGYYGSISFVDEQIGRILAAIERRGLLETTFIFFFSDHGDMTGDHHLWRKSYAYEASARIPFLVRPPAGMNIKRGQVLDQCVEIRDILPTCLEVAGQSIPKQLDSRSLLPLIQGKAKAWRPWIDLEHSICYSPLNNYTALTNGEFKYIYHAHHGEEQLFHLREDPGEIHDLAADVKYRKVTENWRQRMVEHLGERGPQFVQDGKLVPRPKGLLYSPHYPRHASG